MYFFSIWKFFDKSKCIKLHLRHISIEMETLNISTSVQILSSVFKINEH